MNLEQRDLAITVVGRLKSIKRNYQMQMREDLSRELSAVTAGAELGGTKVSPSDLQEVAGNELWAKITNDIADIQSFVNDETAGVK